MFLEDLKPYPYLGRETDKNVVAVGWLAAEHPFPKGSVSDECLRRVLVLCFQPVNQTRGFHQSPFLAPSPMGYPVTLNDKTRLLGSAEIRVQGKNGKTYAAPDLIYHYMKDCNYRPPDEFLDAVMSIQIS
jgi:hypothetical protein